MKHYPLRCPTQIQRYSQVLHLRKGHQKANLAFINNGEVGEQRWLIREPDSALLSRQSFLAVCELMYWSLAVVPLDLRIDLGKAVIMYSSIDFMSR